MEKLKQNSHLLYFAFALFIPIHLFTLYGRMSINYADMPIDARNLYLIVNTASEHENFYQDSNVKKTWSTIVEKTKIESNNPPGLPYSSILYPPQTVSQFYFFNYIPWLKFRWVNYAYNFLLLLIMLLLIKSLASKEMAWMAMLAVLFFKGSYQAYFVGQPMILALTFLLLCWFYYKKDKEWLSGLFFGLAAFKFSLLIPFAFFFLYDKKWKLISSAAGVVVLLLLPIIFQYDILELLKTYSNNATAQIESIFSKGDNELRYNCTQLATVLYEYGILTSRSIPIFELSMLLISSVWVLMIKRNKEQKLFMLILVSLLFFYHISYDAMLMLAFVFVLRIKQKKDLWPYLFFFFFFFFPLNGMLRRFDIDFSLLYLHLPLALLAMLIYEFSRTEDAINPTT